MTKHIYLIRHGETELNRLGIIQGGGVDSSLNDTGRRQAKAFFKKYKHIPFQAVLTSGLQRTHQTVEPFIESGLKWEKFPDIDELHWGNQEGKASTPASHKAYLKCVNDWNTGLLDSKLEGGESASELCSRLDRFVSHLRRREESHLLICSHGRTMRALICLMQDLPLNAMERFGHTNTGLYKFFGKDNIFQIALKNDTSHLVEFEVEYYSHS